MNLPPVPSIASLHGLSSVEAKSRLLDACPASWKEDFSFILEAAEIHVNGFWMDSCVFELRRIRQHHDTQETIQRLLDGYDASISDRTIDFDSPDADKHRKASDCMYCRISDNHLKTIREASGFSGVAAGDCAYLEEQARIRKPTLYLSLTILILRTLMTIAREIPVIREVLANMNMHCCAARDSNGNIYHWTGKHHPLAQGAKGTWVEGIPSHIRKVTFLTAETMSGTAE